MSDNNVDMSPDSSPGGSQRTTGTRRVNNRPMYILLAVVGAFLIIMMLVASDRAEQQNQTVTAEKENAGSTSMFANEIAGAQLDGYIPESIPEPLDLTEVEEVSANPKNELDDIPASTPIEVARPNNLDLPPSPPSGRGRNSYSAANDDAERIRTVKLQMLQEAIKSKTGVQSTAPRSSNSTQNQSYGNNNTPSTRQEMLNEIAAVRQQALTDRSDPTSLYQEKLRQVESQQNTGGGSSVSNSNSASLFQSLGNNVAVQSQGSKWSLDANIETPNSKYELRTGFVIPATLISGVNSELPGQITAQVSQDVFDTPTGRYLLVPQGSRLVGEYSNGVNYGQERLLIAWQRIIFPDGKALDIGAMTGADAAGYSGFKDQVDNHYLRIFGSAILMSGVTAAVNLSQDTGADGDDSQRAGDALSEALGQNLGQVTIEMIRKNMSISPTLNIRPGYRFNVIVTKDMTFSKPYRSFDY